MPESKKAASSEAESAPAKVTVKRKPQVSFNENVCKLDQFVRKQEYSAANNILAMMLTELENGNAAFGRGLTDRDEAAEMYATLFCSAVTQMIADPECVWNDKTFFLFAPLKRAMCQSWEISGYRGTRHLTELVGTKEKNGGRRYTRQDIIKLFWGLSINALSQQHVAMLLRQPAEIAWPLCSGYLSEQIVYSKEAQEARPKIIGAYEHLKNAPPIIQMLRNIGPAYMGCSYDESAEKHHIKYAYNSVMEKWLNSVGVQSIRSGKPRHTNRPKPTVLILAELYDSRHAMHRCYGPSIESLKGHFKTVLMTPNGTMDDALNDMFDVIDDTPFDVTKPAPFFKKALSYKPDIVYFPSIGMRFMSIACSTIRIAPIQVMTFGHPATTLSPCIDYAILDAEQIGSPDTVNEKILCRASKPRFSLREDAEIVAPNLRPKPKVVRIAVPAWSRKVSPVFMQTCVEIEKHATQNGRPVEFWFFPNAVGGLLQAFSRRAKQFVTARVLPRTNYNAYIAELNKCDIFLSSFPFGATNGIVDAIKQGLPVVNLTGPEVHEANDSHIVKRFEQPEWLTANSKEDYIKAVLTLVLKDDVRVKIGKQLLANDPDSKLVSKDGADDFATVLRAAYKHHEQFQKSDQHVWEYEELKELAEADF